MADDLQSIWETHKGAEWPKLSGPHEGELMTLDTVISGCVVYFLDHGEALDLQRLDMLQSCLNDLDTLLEAIPDDSRPYFERLQTLGGLLVEAQPPR